MTERDVFKREMFRKGKGRRKGSSLILLSSPVQLVLLISSAGRFVLRVTESSVTSRTVKTVFSRFFSSCSDLEEINAAQSEQNVSFTDKTKI